MKLDKINSEIQRKKDKIVVLQNELKELEEEKIKIENETVIQAFRSANIDSGEAIKRISAKENIKNNKESGA